MTDGAPGAIRRGLRRFALGLSRRALDILYAPECCVALPGGLLDKWRSLRILEFLDGAGLVDRRRLHRSPEATLLDLVRVHDADYLERLERPGGTETTFGERLPDALEQELVTAQRRMAGATARAAELALERRGTVLHLGGGLHHARADRGAGFCLYNDVAVAIARLRAGGYAAPIAVIDLDLHDGDGTRALFAMDSTVHTLSIHNQPWDDGEAVESTSIALGTGVEDRRYLAAVEESVPPLLDRFRPGLVLFLAGADPAADDALGDWRISEEGMLGRDSRVFDQLARRAIPAVVLLAGGYGEHAWRHPARSLATLLSGGRRVEPPTTATVVMARLRGLAGSLRDGELGNGGNDLLTADDLAEIFGHGAQAPERFLRFYTLAGVELALERLGYLEEIRRLGFEDPRLELDLGRPDGDTLRVYAGSDRSELLLELRARRDRKMLPGFELVWVEWLLLQNPRARSGPDRPLLPGQSHPGLGMLRETMAAMILVCERLKLDGVGVTASHFHPAARSSNHMLFLDPSDAPLFRALVKAVEGLSVPEAALAVEHGGLVDATTGEVFEWRPFSMVLPVSGRLQARFESESYREIAEASEPIFRRL